MKELIDLFAKLLIGTFTFIGPSFTLFISLFYRHSERMRDAHKETKNTLLAIDGNNKEILTEISRFEKKQRLLNPKRQVIRVYLTLLISILFVGFYYFQHTHYWIHKFEWVRVTTILASILLFLYCLLALFQVFSTIIDARHAEERESKDKNITLQVSK